MNELFEVISVLSDLTKSTGIVFTSWDCTPFMAIPTKPGMDTMKYLIWDKDRKRYLVSDKPSTKEVAVDNDNTK